MTIKAVVNICFRKNISRSAMADFVRLAVVAALTSVNLTGRLQGVKESPFETCHGAVQIAVCNGKRGNCIIQHAD